MDTSFCLDALEEAIERFGCPEIINTDQGSQFTSEAFTSKAPPAERVASGSPLKGGEQQSISFVAFSIVMLPSTAETAEKGV